MVKVPPAGVACSDLLPPLSCRRVGDHLVAVLVPNGLTDVPDEKGDGVVRHIEQIHQRLVAVPPWTGACV